MAQTQYGDINPEVAGYYSAQLLKRGQPYLVLQKFGTQLKLPKNSTRVINVRRYNALSATPKALTEGVTPTATQVTKTDLSATLVQYGDRVEITDVVQDTHTDPVLAEFQDILAEQAAEMTENVRFGILKAGTNVFYADAADESRTDVGNKITRPLVRRVSTALKVQRAKKISRVIRSTGSYGTEAVRAAWFAAAHPYLESDIRDCDGFIDAADYGTMSPFEGEIGAVEDMRFIISDVFTAWADSGDSYGGTYRSTSGVLNDVYPILVFGRDAWANVPLAGKNAITPMVVNPKPSDSDPLGQRGHIAWKTMMTALITNDLWMARMEVCASA